MPKLHGIIQHNCVVRDAAVLNFQYVTATFLGINYKDPYGGRTSDRLCSSEVYDGLNRVRQIWF
jgi:hypothetical protein